MRWARVFFAWLVSASAVWWASGGRRSRRDLDRVARFAGLLVFHHAAARMTFRRSGVHRHGRLHANSGHDRRVIGQHLRKAMRGRDFPSRLYAILCVMRDLEKHIARAMRRLRNGLTRLRILDPIACAEPCSAQSAPRAALTDSS